MLVIGLTRFFLLQFYKTFTRAFSTMELSDVVTKLNEMAPLTLASDWDNVGLLLEPSPPLLIKKILLTNDLTLEVAEEAFQMKANLIVSYHPPIFQPLKSLTMSFWKQKIVVRCLESRVAIYSPHTCYDALCGGVNDWLGQAFECISSQPIKTSQSAVLDLGEYKVEVGLPSVKVESLKNVVGKLPGVHLYSLINGSGDGTSVMSIICGNSKLIELTSILKSEGHSSTLITKLDKPPIPNYGMGRFLQLKNDVTIGSAINLIKKHLQLSHLRLALGHKKTLDSPISHVALCAGSGISILKGANADLYLTGEMSHHDILDCTSNGITVVLCEHSNTERGFLPSLAEKIKSRLNSQVHIVISEKDQDPLCII